MSETIKLFSNFFENKKQKDKDFFSRDSITSAYLVGAYASAIVESSWDGVNIKIDGELKQISHVKENETYKKWLSNQQIISSNLLRIVNKASYYQKRFNLDSSINKYLSTLVTDTLKLKRKDVVLQQEISFSFLRGYNDFRTFKYTKKGDN